MSQPLFRYAPAYLPGTGVGVFEGVARPNDTRQVYGPCARSQTQLRGDHQPIVSGKLPAAVREAVEIGMKYEGYLRRQEKQVEEFQKEESRLLPPEIDYTHIEGLRVEARQKLNEIRPLSVGQASRISGVSPSDIAVLLIWLQQHK